MLLLKKNGVFEIFTKLEHLGGEELEPKILLKTGFYWYDDFFHRELYIIPDTAVKVLAHSTSSAM